VANNIAFQQMGPTFKISASAANTSSNVVAITATSPVNQFFVSNPDTNNDVFVAYGLTSNITATIPTSAGANVIHIPAYGFKVFTGPQCSPTQTVYACVIGAGTTPTIYVCPGEGL
jgi:hypothetical protein